MLQGCLEEDGLHKLLLRDIRYKPQMYRIAQVVKAVLLAIYGLQV